ncbi:MAG: ABC transporter ATP-binding protein [Clostridia bacterium]|nr:ABC transporter ATP-binding protein [Clostridia bacterium]
MIFGRTINKYYLRYLPMLLFGLFALILVDYFQLKIPELYRVIINGMNGGTVEIAGEVREFNIDFLLDEICRPMLVVILAMVIGRFLWRVCFFGAGIKMEADLRARMFRNARTLSQQYYQVNKVGNMMALFTNDLSAVQECFGWGVMMLFDALFLGGLSIYKMAVMDWKLTLLSLIPMALLLIAGSIVGQVMTKKWNARQAAYSDISDFSQESFSGIAVIKAFVKEFLELMSFRKLNRKNEEANVDYTKASTLLHIVVTLFVESVICVILGYGGYLVYIERFDAGQLVEFIGYFTAIVWPITALSELIEMRSRGKASLDRIDELLSAEPDVKDSEGVREVESIRGDIEFKNLTFRYPCAENDALSGVSFKINAGEGVGIIGKTGSGKTTLVDLILRTYNVPRGVLFVDGVDVNEIPIRTLRAYSAYVPQDNFLFSDTIASNISFAVGSADTESIIRAATLSDVHDNISEFPEGYQTVLGERGVTVSGGQKQRISIARALVKEASILILDDSVSAVDTATERVILDNLKNSRKGKTTVLIAHRVSTVEGMDKIVFIDDGRVVAVGTHAELCERCPEYKTMVDLQRLEDKEGV